MSSGFVSGGTIDKPIERDEEWLKVQQELEERRRQKEEEGKQNDGKSLYEVLQANKAAKQEAFEEATRLKNQYRALADDEAEFLDSVLEATRKKEAEVRKDTLDQLDTFRKRQEEAEKAAADRTSTSVPTEESEWNTGGRKRKKAQERGPLKGVKLRKSSSAAESSATETDASLAKAENAGPTKVSLPAASSQSKVATSSEKAAIKPAPAPVALNLGYGSSDEDD